MKPIPLLTVIVASVVMVVYFTTETSVAQKDTLLTESAVNNSLHSEHPVASINSALTAESSLTIASTRVELSKRRKIQELVSSEKPEEFLSAYQLIRACIDARLMEVDSKQNPEKFVIKPPEPAAACGDIDAGQQSSRLIYLRRAAEAGVPGAVFRFITEGPTGDGVPDNNTVATPPIENWWLDVEKYLKVGAERGDVYALQTLATRLEQDPNPENLKLSLAYWLLANKMQENLTGRSFKSMERLLEVRKNQLSSEDFNWSLERSRLMFQTIVKRNK
jgi:hypothetical protein